MSKGDMKLENDRLCEAVCRWSNLVNIVSYLISTMSILIRRLLRSVLWTHLATTNSFYLLKYLISEMN